jgi:2,4-dienoyl-CoA reductase (NADPH2)
MENLPHLFSPIRIGNLELPNRVCMLAMTTGYAETDDSVGERMTNFFAERAKSGPGLMVAPFSPVDSGSPVEPGIYDDRFIPGIRRLTGRVHSFGVRYFAQIIISYHIKTKGSPEVVGPSPVWNGVMRCNPRPLEEDEIRWVVEKYGEAAVRAREGGFDGVEIMAGGGYLLNRFISPFGNTREDGYGGSPEKRVRILLEIMEKVKERAGRDFPVSCRLNCDEQMKGGLTIDDCEYISRSLEKAGYAAITVYTGWHEAPKPTVQAVLPRAAFIHLAQKLKGWVGIPVIASNRITDVVTAGKILAEGKADMIGMARAFLADPGFLIKAREGRLSEVVPCLACSECIADAVSGYKDWGQPISVSCAINPAAGREGEGAAAPASVPKKVWVAGAGPGGLEAAIQAALRGHKVTVFEKAGEAGGKLVIGCVPPHKEAISDLIGSMKARAAGAGVEIKLNSALSPDGAAEGEKPDALIVAVGAEPLQPPIPGLNGPNVIPVEDVLSGKKWAGGNVLVIGGGLVGCETAEYMLVNGRGVKAVTVIEMLDRMADNVSPTYRPFFLARLKKAGIILLTGARVTEVTPRGLSIEQGGETKFLEGDAVVLAAGYKANEARNESFRKMAPEVHFIGDCVKARMIRDAVREGYELGRKI